MGSQSTRASLTVLLATALLAGAAPVWCAAAVSEVPLKNPSFEDAVGPNGLPAGWSLYAGGKALRLSLVEAADTGRRALLIDDGDPARAIGIMQTVPARGGVTYEAGTRVRGVAGAASAGAYLQMRFLPSNRHVQTALMARGSRGFSDVSVRGTAPPGTERIRLYLYTHRAPTPKLIVDGIRLLSGVQPPPPPPPKAVPPTYTELKDLHIETVLVSSGKPGVTIIAPASGLYAAEARRIEQAIETKTGVRVPITSDTSPEAAVPITSNLIVLGNRSTNRTIGELYNRYYTLLDLRYPGRGGYVVRTLHNPFGDGRNVIFLGGSDPAGIGAATDRFLERLSRAKAEPGRLVIGRFADIRLGKGTAVPTEVREFKVWDASRGYGSVGYFGWNSISKHMAMYYMTGNERSAREFLRLALPDAKARQEIAEIDGERIENKDEPLSGPYHYNAHLMILFWDLIEESPVFTDAERLRVTNAFARQLLHRRDEGIYGRTAPPRAVGSRHGQWSAVSLYCLARYFQKDYPHPVWRHAMHSARMHFASLGDYAWVGGESDNLFWYNTGIAPIFTYLLLSGDRKPVTNGVLQTLLRGQEILVSGRDGDWALRSASVGFLHKAAHLMQDGRYVTYRTRCGVDTDVFRLGQSFWPEEHLAPVPPDDLVGRWSIHSLSEPAWHRRRNGFGLEESFQFGSYRSATDASGDFVLIDGLNGASRNPYHTFAILQLRIDGLTLLEGYRNQVVTRADGLVEPRVAMNGALRYRDVIGPTAVAVGEVPDAAWCNWRRSLVQRTGKYALIIDDLAFRADSENLEVQVQWETASAVHRTISAPGAMRLTGRGAAQGKAFDVGLCDPAGTTVRGRVATMPWRGKAKKGRHRTFFSLLAPSGRDPKRAPVCVRVADGAAALALPEPALAVVGEYDGVMGEVVVLAQDHLFGKGLRKAGLGGALVSSTLPVNVDWDFATGRLEVVAEKAATISLALAPGVRLRLDGKPVEPEPEPSGAFALRVPAGRHVLAGARPGAGAMATARSRLETLLRTGREARAKSATRPVRAAGAGATPIPVAFTADVGGRVVDLVTMPSGPETVICAAEGETVHVLSSDGKQIRALKTDGPIRLLRWWPEAGLLLAGCADEKVIAFDRAGRRKWGFTSEMDPAVLRAAKTYWFKSAPGHEGIHGLSTGVFLGGKSQAFVGSACTLEILDPSGRLVRRMPQFWGTVSTFAIVDGPNGTLNLLAARKRNGFDRVAIINNATLDPKPRGFLTVPPGHTYVGGWSSMNRHHLFYEDLDGDGVREVVSETNGTWNRVTVWTAAGRALCSANFGPGRRIPARNVRDLDIADLDCDGRKGILTVTSGGLVVALDCRCRKVWATRLASPPTVMKCLTPAGATFPWVVLGCENGDVVVLDGRGSAIRTGRINGAPTCIASFKDATVGVGVLLASAKGEVVLLRVGK